jgi:hypothetical protein
MNSNATLGNRVAYFPSGYHEFMLGSLKTRQLRQLGSIIQLEDWCTRADIKADAFNFGESDYWVK